MILSLAGKIRDAVNGTEIPHHIRGGLMMIDIVSIALFQIWGLNKMMAMVENAEPGEWIPGAALVAYAVVFVWLALTALKSTKRPAKA
ncbi:hypothetical protein CKO11_00550 [Rhodobacter sp. TJ_12]|uniref:hypothetical protein n=1 Tax=Rhodobacter sp. TJ_12 TaxID=2029399 RepID=UPI001CBDA805|nr:hypothetical protein [Rhodobacter sp. TJ_12]MBZ4020949.1 hypothetical protein [Rhodobacter sp. TJ_12]